jgi:hypothetical protein
MPQRRIFLRMLVLGSLIAGGLVATSPPAAANFHEMVITEISDGTVLDPSADFVELQMYSPGQTQLAGHVITTYGPTGTLMQTFTLDENVPNGQSQRTILIGSLSVDEDLTESMTIPVNGALCFENIDCVAWGSISNFTNLTSPAGTPVPGGMPGEDSLQRKITAGCPTLLQASDDTDNSAADFQAAFPTPRNNSVTPTESPCPPGTVGGAPILQGLKAKVRASRAIISGQILPPAPGDQVTLTFFANGSPLRKIAKKSATLNADSKFKKSFRVPTDSTRCKVKVAFQGQAMGKKKFRC